MAPTILPDPVIGLIQWLKDKDPNDPQDFWPAGVDPYIDFYTQASPNQQFEQEAKSAVRIKPSGIGAGTGQLTLGRSYESMRIDAIASHRNDWEARQLGLFMHEAILKVRGRLVRCSHGGIVYDTKFVNIYQSGGPAPFEDAPTGRSHWRSFLYVYNVNFATIPPRPVKAGGMAALPGMTGEVSTTFQ